MPPMLPWDTGLGTQPLPPLGPRWLGRADSPTGHLWLGVSQGLPAPTGSGLECPVCKDDYGLGEHVRQLPCNHLFHDGCIVPWLEQVSEQAGPRPWPGQGAGGGSEPWLSRPTSL